MQRLSLALFAALVLVLGFVPSAWAGQVTAVSAGEYHSTALMNDDTVWAWGGNEFGQLGDMSVGISLASPYMVTSLAGVRAMSAGAYHTAAVKSDGTVWAWGYNYYGQLGDGSGAYGMFNAIPVQAAGLSGVVKVASGWFHTLALKSDGTVWAWGMNIDGQLGDGTNADRRTPVKVTGLTGVVAIAAGKYHSLAVKSDGTVWAWGENSVGQLGNGNSGYGSKSLVPVQVLGLTQVKAVAAGGYHSLAVKNDGTVWAWGMSSEGQLGDGTQIDRKTPVQVVGLNGVVDVDAGDGHSVALKNDGTLWGWGYNWYGQIGANGANSLTPVQFAGVGAVTAFSAGGEFTIIVRSDGAVLALGRNQYGQLGDGAVQSKYTPIQVPGVSGAKAVAAGYDHTMALGRDGTVWTLGSDELGQLGDGFVGYEYSRFQPAPVRGLTGVSAISAHRGYSMAVAADGALWGWGDNGEGQMGDGTRDTRGIATPGKAALAGVAKVAAGNYHVLALKSDGTVWAWGDDWAGQLGDGQTYSERWTPGQVAGLSNVVAIAAGYYHSLAVKSDGTVWAWGDNGGGQLGDGTQETRTTPVRVTGLTGVVAVSAGQSHSLALKSDGTVWAWGQNSSGELGDGGSYEKYSPVWVQGLTGIVAIASAWHHSLALKNDGTVWAWGQNTSGALGDGTDQYRRTPVKVVGLTDVVGVAVGYYHSLAVKSDGSVWGWGYNSGALGYKCAAEASPVPSVVSGLDSVTISQAKNAARWSNVTVSGAVVTARFDDCIYIQSPNRMGGIKVVPAPMDADAGKLIRANGNVDINNGEKILSLVSYQVLPGTGSVQPMAMINKYLGGGNTGYDPVTGAGQKGIAGASGLGNIGLLVKTWGKVTDVDPSAVKKWFTLTDGSGVGVKVKVPAGVNAPGKGSCATVTGISSCEEVDGKLQRLLRVRKQSDIAP